MRPATFLLPAALWLAACSPTDTPTTAADSAAATAALPPPDTARAAAVNAQSDTLHQVRRRHLFSSPGQPDLFTLVLRGPDMLNGAATFTITDAGGQVIFREQLSAADLEAAMVYEMHAPTATEEQRQAYLLRRIDTFFADKNFQKPALPASATYAPGPLDRPTWDDLHRRPDAISFAYLVGKEDHHRIAWSPLKKQVVQL